MRTRTCNLTRSCTRRAHERVTLHVRAHTVFVATEPNTICHGPLCAIRGHHVAMCGCRERAVHIKCVSKPWCHRPTPAGQTTTWRKQMGTRRRTKLPHPECEHVHARVYRGPRCMYVYTIHVHIPNSSYTHEHVALATISQVTCAHVMRTHVIDQHVRAEAW